MTIESGDNDWPFDVPKNIGCITTRQVFKEGYPVLSILHDEDGAWQVLCDTTEDPNDGMLVSLDCLFEAFPIMIKFLDIPRGYEATRQDENSEWEIFETDYSED